MNQQPGLKHALLRADQYANIQWTPVADLKGQTAAAYSTTAADHGEKIFSAGVVQTGLPYSSVKGSDNFIGVNVLPETFMTALKNPKSKLYTTHLFQKSGDASYRNTFPVYNKDFSCAINATHGNANLYYGVVCSVMAKHIFDLITYETTYSWKRSEQITDRFCTVYDCSRDFLGIRDFRDIESGDVLIVRQVSTGGGHLAFIADVKKDADGNPTEVTVIESGYPTVSRRVYTDMGKAKYDLFTPEKDASGEIKFTREVYRFKDLGSVAYKTLKEFIAVGDELADDPYVYNTEIGLDKGNKSHYRRSQGGLMVGGEDIVVTKLTDDASVTGVKVYGEDGTEIAGSPFSFTAGEEQPSVTIPVASLEAGQTYTVRANGFNSDAEPAQTFYVYDTGMAVFGIDSVYEDGGYICGQLTGQCRGLEPGYVSLSSLNGTIKRTAPVLRDPETGKLCFRIQLNAKDDADGAWNDQSATNKGSMVFKAHFSHPFGYCVSLPVDLTKGIVNLYTGNITTSIYLNKNTGLPAQASEGGAELIAGASDILPLGEYAPGQKVDITYVRTTTGNRGGSQVKYVWFYRYGSGGTPEPVGTPYTYDANGSTSYTIPDGAEAVRFSIKNSGATYVDYRVTIGY